MSYYRGRAPPFPCRAHRLTCRWAFLISQYSHYRCCLYLIVALGGRGYIILIHVFSVQFGKKRWLIRSQKWHETFQREVIFENEKCQTESHIQPHFDFERACLQRERWQNTLLYLIEVCKVKLGASRSFNDYVNETKLVICNKE